MTLWHGTTWDVWYKRTVDKVSYQKKRAKQAGKPAVFCPADWRAALRYWSFRCAYCGTHETAFEHGLTLDHFLPLGNSDSGGTTVYNLLPCCPDCNNSKDDRNPYEWLIETFGEREGLAIADRIENYFDQVESWSGTSNYNRVQYRKRG